MIRVTKTFLPSKEVYQKYLDIIWENSWLTNRGVLVKDLESKLKKHLGVEYITLTTNGTLPIQIALKALKVSGEVITTPFSYVATTSSIVWEHCKPVFVDIHPEYLTIDETKIEAAITSETTAILATHVFGNPCYIEEIERIAKKHNLKVIYDAAHCFDVSYNGQSIFNYGDVSTCSFHATKLFHTGEGGCWITTNKELQDQVFYYHNFGHDGPGKFYDVGINAKMSELQAAMGLSVLPNMDYIIEERKRVVNSYLNKLNKTKMKFLKIRENTVWNYSYFPVIFESEDVLKKVVTRLEEHQIFTRRYFFPSLNTLEYIEYKPIPISESISKRVLCLPLFTDLEEKNINTISAIINSLV